MLGILLVLPSLLSSCGDDELYDTNQYQKGVALNVFGPSPVARGGELRFLGSGLTQINKIELPGSGDITDIQRLSDNEIRITVPQDAEPGYVKLHHAGGVIQTKTMLTYSEPISIEAISPMEVKPGSVLTIDGEYLNLMHRVIFSNLDGNDDVYVDEADFVEHSRKVIKVTVPEEAITGKIAISDAQELPNLIRSAEEVAIVLPSVSAPLDLSKALPGSSVTVKGSNLDLVRDVQVPSGASLDFSYDSSAESITFTLPDNISDGAIVAIPASGVKVAIANVGVVVPTELEAIPADGIRANDEILIRGVNMHMVSSVSLPNVADPVIPTEVTATTVKFLFPAMAQSGDAVLNLKSGKSVSIYLATAKPDVQAFNPSTVSAAASFTMIGRDLDLITKVTFGGGVDMEIVPVSSTEITMIAPATATSGALTLTMANGETVVTPELTIQAPECAFITSVVTENLTAGEMMVANIKNSDKLTGVTVNGANVNYVVNKDQLFLSLPQSCGKNTVVTLISSNGEISYTYDVIPATHVEKVLIEGPFSLDWAGDEGVNKFRIYKEALEGVPAGANMIFHVVPSAGAQIQVNDANWSQVGWLEPAEGTSTIALELTADVLNHFMTTEDGWSSTAIIVQGANCVVSKVTVEWENSLETTIWEGAWESGEWNGNQDLAWGGFDWTSVKAGQILRLYADAMTDGWWCISLRHGNGWGNIPGLPGQYDTPANPLEVVLTQEVIDDLNANGGLVITGASFRLTKVTLE